MCNTQNKYPCNTHFVTYIIYIYMHIVATHAHNLTITHHTINENQKHSHTTHDHCQNVEIEQYSTFYVS